MRPQKKPEILEYDLQAEKFLKDTGATITSKYTGHRKYFSDDTEHRATFEVTIQRGEKKMMFEFGNSTMNSWKMAGDYYFPGLTKPERAIARWKGGVPLNQWILGTKIANTTFRTGEEHKGSNIQILKSKAPPSAYSILTCIEKNDPETFDDWCDNLGYSNDSIKARDLYFKCQKQYSDLTRIFTQEEIGLLQEIQ